MIDAVLSYHLNPYTCGVAKFNQELARRLGVPCLPLCGRSESPLISLRATELAQQVGVPVVGMDHLTICERPLLSIKPSEMRHPYIYYGRQGYDVLLHDRFIPCESGLIQNALRVFYADELGCPSTIHGNPTRGAYRVLTFGMAHKLLLPHFEALKAHLDAEHPDYTVELSTAVHEGSPWDETLAQSTAAMRTLFGDHLRVLGFLGDDALAKELQDVDAVALYYEPALRANNTTYWAAVEAGKTIYTNRDAQSPQPDDPPVTWERLLEVLRA